MRRDIRLTKRYCTQMAGRRLSRLERDDAASPQARLRPWPRWRWPAIRPRSMREGRAGAAAGRGPRRGRGAGRRRRAADDGVPPSGGTEANALALSPGLRARGRPAPLERLLVSADRASVGACRRPLSRRGGRDHPGDARSGVDRSRRVCEALLARRASRRACLGHAGQ